MTANREHSRDPDTRLAQRLMREGRIPHEVGEAALARKANSDLRFEDALLELGFGEVQLLRILAEVYRTQFITTDKLSKTNVSERVIRLIPQALAERRLVVPLALDAERKLLVVTPDPESLDAIKDILIASQAREVKALVARPLAVRAAISRYYEGDQRAFTALAPTGFFEDNQQITDSQGSFALFHSQLLGERQGPASSRPISTAPPSAPEPQRARSQPALRRPPSLSSLRAAEPVQHLEPPPVLDDDPISQFESTLLEEIEEPFAREILKSSPLRKAPQSVRLGGAARVSSLPPLAEPDQLEVIDASDNLLSIAQPLRLVEALVSLHERGRKHLADHSVNVAKLAASLCFQLGVSLVERSEAELAGLIHDLGKSRIYHLTAYNLGLSPDYERLARDEYMAPTLLLEQVGLPPRVVTAVNHMYERYDGRGFPSGLCGEEIPLLSRIVALADSYADLTLCSENAFHRVLSAEEAIHALGVSAIFDPTLLECLSSLRAGAGSPISAFAEG